MDPAYAWPPPPTLAEAPGWFRWLLTLARAVRDRLHVPWERVADADLSLRLVLALLAAALLVHAVIRLTRSAAQAAELAARPPGVGGLRDEAWSWRRAEEFAAAGRHGPAMLAAFHAAMQALAARGRVRYRPSATPRELLAEARVSADARQRLDLLLGALYRTAFAAEPLTPEDYRAWLTELKGTADAAAA